MNSIHLYGHLAEQFGETVELEVESASEAIRALALTRPGFESVLRDGSFILIRQTFNAHERLKGEALTRALANEDIQLDVDTLTLGLGKSDLHIVPVIGGAGGNGIGKVLLGIALIAGAWIAAPAIAAGGLGATAFSVAGMAVSFGNIAMFGALMALTGLSSMLIKPPEAPDPKGSEETNFIFQGAANISAQGNPVPVVHGGPIRVGSLTISGAITTESRRTFGKVNSQKPDGIFSAIMDRDADGYIDGTVYEDTISV